MNRPSTLLAGATQYWVMRLYDPADGVTLIDADSTPTVAVRKNGSSTGDSVTVTKRSSTTGIYDCSYNPSGESEGDKFTIEETATISSTAYSQNWEFTVVAAERGTDSAALNSDMGTLLVRLTSTRAGYLDNLSGGAAALSSDIATLLGRIIGTIASGTHSPQSGDAYAIANNGTYGNSALNTDIDALLARLTSARAGYLDNLSGGTVATSSEVTAIQNNTRVVRVVPDVIERPDSGTTTYRVELLLYDAVGNMEAPDSAPTIELVNQAGTSRASRLDSATMTLVETGRYRAIYTADSADTLEQLVWTFSVTEGGATRKYGNQSLIVDTTAVDFTAADRTKLDTIYGKMPTRPYLAASTANTGAILPSDLGMAAADLDSQLAGISAQNGTLLSRILGTLAVGTHNPQSGDSYPIVSSGVHGNAALKTLIDAANSYLSTNLGAAGANATAAGLSSTQVADAVWLAALATYSATVGSTAEALAAAAAGGGGGGGDATAANQVLILAAIGAMQGAGFDTNTDSLVEIAQAIANIPTGTAELSAQERMWLWQVYLSTKDRPLQVPPEQPYDALPTFFLGDDYTETSPRGELTWAIAPSEADLTGASAVLTFSLGKFELHFQCTVRDAGLSTQRITAAVTAKQSGVLLENTKYRFQVQATLADGTAFTPVDGFYVPRHKRI